MESVVPNRTQFLPQWGEADPRQAGLHLILFKKFTFLQSHDKGLGAGINTSILVLQENSDKAL